MLIALISITQHKIISPKMYQNVQTIPSSLNIQNHPSDTHISKFSPKLHPPTPIKIFLSNNCWSRQTSWAMGYYATCFTKLARSSTILHCCPSERTSIMLRFLKLNVTLPRSSSHWMPNTTYHLLNGSKPMVKSKIAPEGEHVWLVIRLIIFLPSTGSASNRSKKLIR